MENQGFGISFNRFMPEYVNQAGIFLCTSGTADFIINNQRFQIERGRLYIIGPLVRVYMISQSLDFNGIHILDDQAVFFPVLNSMIDTVVRLHLRDNPCLQLNEQDIAFIEKRGEEIRKKQDILKEELSFEEKNIVRKMIHLLEQETLLEVIQIYFRNQPVDSHPIDKKEGIVRNFIYSLHVNFKTERSVSFYAGEAKLSVGYFKTVIKDKTGRTPSEWIVLITIEQARIMLLETTKSIKDIAAELHFPEQFTFRKYFKQHTGMAPKEYRLSHTQSNKSK